MRENGAAEHSIEVADERMDFYAASEDPMADICALSIAEVASIDPSRPVWLIGLLSACAVHNPEVADFSFDHSNTT